MDGDAPFEGPGPDAELVVADVGADGAGGGVDVETPRILNLFDLPRGGKGQGRARPWDSAATTTRARLGDAAWGVGMTIPSMVQPTPTGASAGCSAWTKGLAAGGAWGRPRPCAFTQPMY